MLDAPQKADPEIASVLFGTHLETCWKTALPGELGLTKRQINTLHWLIGLSAVRVDGTKDPYFILLGAEFYDRWPPTAAFVDPGTLNPVSETSPFWPKLRANPPWIQLHNQHRFSDGTSGQMICCTCTAEYYRSAHTPTEDTIWRQGKHTVTATITRIAEILAQPYYEAPAG